MFFAVVSFPISFSEKSQPPLDSQNIRKAVQLDMRKPRIFAFLFPDSVRTPSLTPTHLPDSPTRHSIFAEWNFRECGENPQRSRHCDRVSISSVFKVTVRLERMGRQGGESVE